MREVILSKVFCNRQQTLRTAVHYDELRFTPKFPLQAMYLQRKVSSLRATSYVNKIYSMQLAAFCV